MQYSVVTYKTVKENSDFRIDAEYFKPEYLEIENTLKRINSKFLRDYILEITGGATPLGANYSTMGIPFLRVQNIMQNYFDDENIVFLSDKQDNEIKRSKLRKGDLLLTITGAYGKSAVVESEFHGANINQHSVLIRLANNLNPYFVSTFLNCYFGKKQSDKNIIGVSRPALDYQRIKRNFLIPLLPEIFQVSIEKIIKNAHQKHTHAQQLYSQAQDLLLSELGLTNWQPQRTLSFIKNFSETQKARRIDAEYFQPRYQEIIEVVKKYSGGFDELGNMVKIIKCVEPGSGAYLNAGIPFIRVSNLSKIGISTNNQQYISKDLYKQLKTHQPKQNEILLSKDATPGIAYHLANEPQQMIPAGGILRLKIVEGKILPEYLTLVLNSIIVQKQIERNAGGSIINHWRPDQVRSTIVPILDSNNQEKIRALIKKSFEDRHLSQLLLQVAKRGVEIAIEDSETTAEKWIESEIEKLNRPIP